MQELVGGVYIYSKKERLLLLPGTNQSLKLVGRPSGHFAFRYQDGEVSRDFIVRAKAGGDILLDFAQRDLDGIAEAYGLWRRLSFFLLDGLPCWFYCNSTTLEGSWVTGLRGCWVNGSWKPRQIIQSKLERPSPQENHSYETGFTHTLAPLQAKPIAWTYACPPEPEAIAELEFSNSGTSYPLVVEPIENRLSRVPRFVRADGKAFLFHRYIESHYHRGEDFAPIPYYGYVNEACAYSMRAHYFYGIDTFFEPALRANSSGRLDLFASGHESPTLHTVTLSRILREELLFALLDISSLSEENKATYPFVHAIKESIARASQNSIDDARAGLGGIQFGHHLSFLSGLPISFADVWRAGTSIGVRWGWSF